MWLSIAGRRISAAYRWAVEWRRDPAGLSYLRLDVGVATVFGERRKAVSPGAGSFRVRRCSNCAINWAPYPEFKVCEKCGEGTSDMLLEPSTSSGEHAPSRNDSLRYRDHLRSSRAAEAAAEQAAREEQLAPIISAATAYLRYEIDHWTSEEGAAWAEAEAAGR